MHYAIALMKPDTSMKMMDSTMHIQLKFTEQDAKAVHHLNVLIYQKADTTNVIYNKPTDAHVHDQTSEFV